MLPTSLPELPEPSRTPGNIKTRIQNPTFYKTKINNIIPHFLTCTEASRPQNLTIGVNVCVESDFEVKNTEVLDLDLEN